MCRPPLRIGRASLIALRRGCLRPIRGSFPLPAAVPRGCAPASIPNASQKKYKAQNFRSPGTTPSLDCDSTCHNKYRHPRKTMTKPDLANVLPLAAAPLYEQIKTELRARILNGTYAAHSQMPSEN